MNAARLLLLADYLEEVPPHRFDMVVWIRGGKFCERGGDERKHACGTTACAMGWASTIPKFKELGLMVIDGGIQINGLFGISAACELFGLRHSEATELFAPCEYDREYDRETPGQCADRIRQFANQAQEQPCS